MIQIKWCWFHTEISIFGQVVMAKMACMPISGLTFFDHNSAILRPIELTFSMGDYYLSIGDENSKLWSYDAHFYVLLVRATFGGKMELALMIWGLQNRPKSWPTWWTFWANHYLEIMFWYFQDWTLLLNKLSFCILALAPVKRTKLIKYWPYVACTSILCLFLR